MKSGHSAEGVPLQHRVLVRPRAGAAFVDVAGSVLAVALVGGIPMLGTAPSGAASVPKFPGAAWARAIGPTHLSSPVIADVNGDGTPDVVTSDLSGICTCSAVAPAATFPGWPQPIQIVPGQTVASESSPTVADLDKNGHKEIIVGAGSLDVGGQQGGVEAFNANGTPRWRIKTQTVEGESGVPGTPAVGDVNGDGHPDVVFGSWDHGIYAVNRSGHRSRDSRTTASTRSGTPPRSTTRATPGRWTSSSAATRAPAVRADRGVGPACCARSA